MTKKILELEMYNEILDSFCQKFAGCFCKEQPKPLKVGIHKDLKALQEKGEISFTITVLSKFIGIYCLKKKYLKALILGSERVDLNGNRAGEVSLEEATNAKKVLKKRYPKNPSSSSEASEPK